MQLLNRYTVPTKARASKSDVTIRCEKNGSFYIAGGAVDLIGLAHNDRVVLMWDKELYLTKTITNEGYQVRNYANTKKQGLYFTSSGLRNKLKELLKLTSDQSFLFTVHESPLEPTPFIKWHLKLEVHHG